MERDKLKHLRIKTGQTLKEFGNRLGVTAENQGQIERGIRKPSASYTLNLMKLFNFNVDETKKMLKL